MKIELTEEEIKMMDIYLHHGLMRIEDIRIYFGDTIRYDLIRRHVQEMRTICGILGKIGRRGWDSFEIIFRIYKKMFIKNLQEEMKRKKIEINMEEFKDE